MATYRTVTASPEQGSVRIDFESDVQGHIVWRLYDPGTGIILGECEPVQMSGTNSLRIALPDEGAYRIHVSRAEEAAEYISLDAELTKGRLAVTQPRVVSARRERWARIPRSIPKAFSVPAASLWANRKLIASMVKRDILARYRGSFGGALWTMLTPLLLMATYFFVFGVVLKTRFSADASGTGYVLYFLAGMLPWLAFSEAVGRSPSVILEYRTFVKKLVFPLDTLPMNLVLAGLVTEAIGIVIFMAGLFAARGSVPVSVAWLPVVLIPQILFTAGLSWILAATGVFVRDLGQVIGFLLTLWFFLTPICYEERTDLPEWVLGILSVNPILHLVRGYRAILLENQPPWSAGMAGLWVGSAAVAILGYAWFHRLRKSFADVI